MGSFSAERCLVTVPSVKGGDYAVDNSSVFPAPFHTADIVQSNSRKETLPVRYARFFFLGARDYFYHVNSRAVGEKPTPYSSLFAREF